MLTLSLAHVPNDLIAADYALTEHALRRVLAANDPELDPASWRDLPPTVIGSVPATALATLEFIDESYGSVSNYLVDLGLDKELLERFKQEFTEPEGPR
jgi:protein tyrosine/serine phosphatase